MSDQLTDNELQHSALIQSTKLAEVAPKRALIVADDDYGADVGVGIEDAGADEFLIPFIRLLQSNSPQCDESQAGIFIESARPGMMINTATQELYSGKDGLGIIPVHRDHVFIEYVPRDAGGGFIGIWSPEDPRIKPLQESQGKYTKLRLANGNDLVESFSLYAIVFKNDGTIMRAVFSFASTQIKVYKGFMTRMGELLIPVNPPRPFPIFAHRWRLRSVPMKNKKGSFYGWSMMLDGTSPEDYRYKPKDPHYLMAKQFRDHLLAGDAKADYERAEVATQADVEEDMPF